MTTDEERADTARTAYWRAFNAAPPSPASVSDEYLAEVLEQAVADATPVPEDFDWYEELPPDALA